jgi:hypothetical protein
MSTTQRASALLVWSGLVWSGLVWSGLVWSGLVWSSLIVHCTEYMHCIGLAAVEHDYPDESDTDGGGGAGGPHSGNRTAAPRARAATGHGLLERVAGGWFPFQPTA